MVKVPGPEDIPQVSPQRLRAPSVRVTADDFGAGVAEDTARFGNVALKTVLGGVAKGLRQRRQEAEDGAFVTAAVAEGRDRLSTLLDELEGLATEGPEDLAAAFQRRAAEETETLVADLRQRGQRPSRSGMAEAMRQLEGLQANFGVEAATFENNARVGRLSQNLNDTLAAAEGRALSHPEQLHGLLQDVERAAARLAPHVPTDTLEAMRQSAPERIATAALSGLMTLDPAGARDGLAAGDFDNFLGDGMKGALGRQAAAEAEGAAARRKAREALDKEDSARDLAGGIAAGAKGFPDIARAVQDDLIDTDGATRLERRLEARLAADQRVAGALAGDTPLDAGDAMQARALDRYYRDAFMPSLRGVAEEQALPRLMAFVGRAGFAPDTLVRKLRAGVLSERPELQAVLAAPVAALDALGPGFVAAIPLDEQARAHAIAGFAGLGLAPARAAELGNGLFEKKGRVPAAAPSPEVLDMLERPGDEDPDINRPLPLAPADGDEPPQINDLVHRPHMVTDPDGTVRPEAPDEKHRRTARPMVERPGFVWENDKWRRETPEEAQNHIQLKSGEAGDDDDDDDDSDDGDSGGNGGDAPGEPGGNGGPDSDGDGGADSGDGQKPDAKPDDSEIPDVVKPIVARISQVASIFSAARRRFCYKNHEVVACMERWIWHTRWVNRNRGAFGSILTAA